MKLCATHWIFQYTHLALFCKKAIVLKNWNFLQKKLQSKSFFIINNTLQFFYNFIGFSFAFPVTLTVPLAVTLLISACGLRNEDPCIFQDTIPDYLYWECPDGDFLNDFISNQHAWIWIVWLLSQTWIGIHIFMPHCERLAPTEKLFVTPMYLSLLIGNF